MADERWTLPNTITVVRILVCPAIFFLALSPTTSLRVWAFVLFVAAGLSDVWDGWLARKYDLTLPIFSKLHRRLLELTGVHLVLSGFTETQEAEVDRLFCGSRLRRADSCRKNGWLCLRLSRN